MGIFKKKKGADVATAEELEEIAVTETGSLGEAERVASVIKGGLEKDDFSEMNRHLSNIALMDGHIGKYVFDFPGTLGRAIGAVLCAAFSVVLLFTGIIGVCTMLMSRDLFILGLLFAVASFGSIAILAPTGLKYLKSITFKKRYDVYVDLLGYKGIEFVDDIAFCAGQPEAQVVKDLQKAVKLQIIPQGHFSTDDVTFMVSDETYGKYLENRAAYDRYFKQRLEARRQEAARPEEVTRILEDGKLYIEKIQSYGNMVKDKNVSKKIAEIERVAAKIFREVEVDYEHAKSLGVFLNYYLPTSEKLLEAYVTMGDKQDSGASTTRTKKDIEEALSSIVTAFEGILEKLYEEYEVDVTADIAAMELSMKQEGLTA